MLEPLFVLGIVGIRRGILVDTGHTQEPPWGYGLFLYIGFCIVLLVQSHLVSLRYIAFSYKKLYRNEKFYKLQNLYLVMSGHCP
jgi:hypothetical protein